MVTHQLYAAWAFLLCNGGPTPPGNQGILGDPNSNPILGEDGNPILGE